MSFRRFIQNTSHVRQPFLFMGGFFAGYLLVSQTRIGTDFSLLFMAMQQTGTIKEPIRRWWDDELNTNKSLPAMSDLLRSLPMELQLEWLSELLSEYIPYIYTEDVVHEWSTALFRTIVTHPGSIENTEMVLKEVQEALRNSERRDELVMGMWRMGVVHRILRDETTWCGLASLAILSKDAATLIARLALQQKLQDSKIPKLRSPDDALVSLLEVIKIHSLSTNDLTKQDEFPHANAAKDKLEPALVLLEAVNQHLPWGKGPWWYPFRTEKIPTSLDEAVTLACNVKGDSCDELYQWFHDVSDGYNPPQLSVTY